MLIWIFVFVFISNMDVRWMYPNPIFNIIRIHIIWIIWLKSDVCVDAKRAPSAKHTASRTSWLYTRRELRDVPVNFSWKLTKDKAVRYPSLELAGWYQTVPYLRLQSQVGMTHSYKKLSANKLKTIRELIQEKVTLSNGWHKHDSDRSLFEQRCTCTRPWPIPMIIIIE
jgi:hypothetical protein